MDKIPLTKAGYDALNVELKTLKSVERPAIIAAIAEARAHGDLSENAEYHSAKEKQSFIEGRIKELEGAISLADVIDTSKLSGSIRGRHRKRTFEHQIAVGAGLDRKDRGRQRRSADPRGRAQLRNSSGYLSLAGRPRPACH